MPILSSFFETLKPFVPRSTMNADIPPAAALVRLVGGLEPGEAARLRAALDAAADPESAQ